MRNNLFSLILITMSITAQAADGNSRITTVGRLSSALELPVGSLGARVCWYRGEQYSKGARIRSGEIWLACVSEHPYETNGALSWKVAGGDCIKEVNDTCLQGDCAQPDVED